MLLLMLEINILNPNYTQQSPPAVGKSLVHVVYVDMCRACQATGGVMVDSGVTLSSRAAPSTEATSTNHLRK